MNKTVFYWELPKDHPDFTGHDDLPEAYMVDQNDEASCGIIVHAKWNGKWEANPWNTRTLIRHLLIKLSAMEKTEKKV